MFRAKLKTDKTVQAAVSGSGDIVSFESAFEKPLTDLVLNITPIQSGEGDPSPENIRPISGWDGANVWRGGKNFCPKLVAQSNAGMTLTVDENGVATLSGESTGVEQVIGLKSFHLTKGTYTMTGGGDSNYSLRLYNEDTSNTIARLQSETASVTFTLDKLTRTRIFVRTDVVAAVSGLTFRPMIRLATDTDATYEPYKGDTYPVTWSDTAGTVFGGTLDVVRGKLTRTHTLRLMTGENDGSTVQMFSTKSAASADISEYATGNLTTFSDYGRSAGAFTARYVPNEALDRYGFACSVAPSRIGGESDVLLARLYIGANGGTQLRMRFPFEWGIDTINKANQWLADLNATGTPCQYWVKLRTNYEYDLDPVTIQTLLGQNNIWGDCGDIASLKLDAVSGKLKFKLIQ